MAAEYEEQGGAIATLQGWWMRGLRGLGDCEGVRVTGGPGFNERSVAL